MKRIPGFLLVLLLSLASSAQWATPADAPAYHPAGPSKLEKLPPILKPAQLSAESRKFPFQTNAYLMAAKVPDVIYQQPCYCYCSRSVGHKSLRSCFESEHGAHCGVCMKEAVFAYQQTKAGKTPQQIREAIMRGDWQQVNLE